MCSQAGLEPASLVTGGKNTPFNPVRHGPREHIRFIKSQCVRKLVVMRQTVKKKRKQIKVNLFETWVFTKNNVWNNIYSYVCVCVCVWVFENLLSVTLNKILFIYDINIKMSSQREVMISKVLLQQVGTDLTCLLLRPVAFCQIDISLVVN